MPKIDAVTNEQIERDLISSMVEKHLLSRGRSLHEQFIQDLLLHGHLLDDCYTNAEILVKTVMKHFIFEGDAVILSIEKELRRSTSATEGIKRFLDTLCSSYRSYLFQSVEDSNDNKF